MPFKPFELRDALLAKIRHLGNVADGSDDIASLVALPVADLTSGFLPFPVFDPPSDGGGWTPPPDSVPPNLAPATKAAASLPSPGPAAAPTAATTPTGDQGDLAMHGNIARSTYGVDGTGLRIGIISDSFNNLGGEAADQAAGNLPTGSNMVIVDDYGGGGTDEGRAMAELVYRVAPGAQIYFASDQDSDDGTANAVTTLAADGCNVIVDDISLYDDPFFEPGGEVPQAIQAVVAQGVNYFTSAGNNGNDYYYSAWTPMPASYDLPGVGVVPVQDVGDGQPYEFVDIGPSDFAFLDIQWDQPFSGIGTYTGDTPYIMGVAVYDAQYNFLYTDTFPVDPDPYVVFPIYDTTNTRGVYLAFYVSSGTGVPGAFKAMFINEEGNAEFAGPGAGVGSGGTAGHAMEAGVNSVGAIDYTETPQFGTATPENEYFSSYSGSQYLFDANGNRLATPEPAPGVTFSAPDGVDTDVFGDFYGTSAAAPDAAAVALLVLQEDPRLTTVQVTYVLASTAIATATPVQGGAGLVQADGAVGLAHTAITTPIWTGQSGSTAWETAANWSDNAVPGSSDTITLSNGLGLFPAAYSVVYSTPLGAVAALVVSGGDNGPTPVLSIAAGDDLDAGTVTIGTGGIDISGALIINGSLFPGGGAAPHVSIDAGGILDIGGNDQYAGIAFFGAGSLLFDSSTPSITGPITGFSTAGIIDLTGLAYNPTNQIVIDGSTVSLETADATTLIAFTLSGNFSGLALAADGRAGAAGTVIFATAALLPVIVAPARLTLNAGISSAIGGVGIVEDGATAGEIFTVLLADTNGRLSASGIGVSGSTTTNLTITGSMAQVNADLATLTDSDGTTPSDSIQITATDDLGNVAVARQIAVAVNGVLTLNAPASATVALGNASPLAGVSLSESGNTFGEDFTVTLVDANGDLSADGPGVSGFGNSLTITGSLSQVNADLATLTDTEPNAVGTTPSDPITVTASDGAGFTTQVQIAVAVSGLVVGTNGAFGAAGKPGGGGQSVTAQAADSSLGNNQSLAVGGDGGNGGSAAAGGAGGGAAATAATTIADAIDTTLAQATADGGAGGGGGTGRGGNGGRGGHASAAATATNEAGSAEAFTLTTGGSGGGASGTGASGGQGGVASGTTASASALTDAASDAEQAGGDGGSGVQGAAGAAGATSLLVNAVAGETNGGALNLYQDAYGGNGGDSDTSSAGAGGSAASSLSFNDAGNTTQSTELTGIVGAFGGAAGTGALFGPQGGAASATEVLTAAGDLVEAQGQSFGGIGGGGSAGKGGTASAAVTSIVADDFGDSVATADSYGGYGGYSQSGNGGSGGASSGAVAVAEGGYSATASALGEGGTGGDAVVAGHVGGAGGVASGTTAQATADGVDHEADGDDQPISADATEIGGDGGSGYNGAAGGVGGQINLVNAVSGSTDNGVLSLSQIAQAGDGGASDTGVGGAGGSALSQLTLNDTANRYRSAELDATIAGTGGNGGNSGGIGGNGGSSWDAGTVTGIAAVMVQVTAQGGAAGAGGARGGDAQAKSSAAGTKVSSTAIADAGTGLTAAGIANSTAQANGTSGTVTAETQTALLPGSLIISASGYASASVNGAATAGSQAGIGSTTPWANDTAIAVITGAPLASNIDPVLAANPAITAALGTNATILALGEVGGGHSGSGTDTQTSTATTDITFDQALLASQQDLIIALYQPRLTGSFITDIHLAVAAGGANLLSQDFSSAASAVTWFTNHPIDLGSMAGASSVDVDVALSVTSTKAGSLFNTGFLLADRVG